MGKRKHIEVAPPAVDSDSDSSSSSAASASAPSNAPAAVVDPAEDAKQRALTRDLKVRGTPTLERALTPAEIAARP